MYLSRKGMIKKQK